MHIHFVSMSFTFQFPKLEKKFMSMIKTVQLDPVIRRSNDVSLQNLIFEEDGDVENCDVDFDTPDIEDLDQVDLDIPDEVEFDVSQDNE